MFAAVAGVCGARHTVIGIGAEEGENLELMEAAFFDLDKTIVARSSPLAFGRTFLKEGLIGRSTLLKSLYAQVLFRMFGADEAKMEKMRVEAAKLTAGWEQQKVREVVAEVLDEVISPLIYAEALDLMHDHRAAGRLIVIVSSSPEEIVEPLAKMIRVDHWIATRPKIVDGVYTGELDFYAYGQYKAQAIEDLARDLDINLGRSFAYSDSVTDLPMLQLVGNPVAVNPDKELRRIALESGWTIETFRSPVPVRPRLPHLPRPTSPLDPVVVAAAMLVVTVLVWRLSRRSGVR